MRNSSASDAVRDAQVNEAIAQDVAQGMAEKAERQEVRANLYATEAARKAELANVLQQNTVAAQAESQSTKFTLWLVLGILAVGILGYAIYYFTHQAPTETTSATSAVVRPASTGATPGPGLIQSNPNPNQTTVTSAPKPSVQRAPVAALPANAVGSDAAPASSGTTTRVAPVRGSLPATSGDKPLQGYVAPTP